MEYPTPGRTATCPGDLGKVCPSHGALNGPATLHEYILEGVSNYLREQVVELLANEVSMHVISLFKVDPRFVRK